MTGSDTPSTARDTDHVSQRGKLGSGRRDLPRRQLTPVSEPEPSLLLTQTVPKGRFTGTNGTPTFIALKSFFIFSGIPVMKESSGSSRISPFRSFGEKPEGESEAVGIGLP